MITIAVRFFASLLTAVLPSKVKETVQTLAADSTTKALVSISTTKGGVSAPKCAWVTLHDSDQSRRGSQQHNFPFIRSVFLFMHAPCECFGAIVPVVYTCAPCAFGF